MKVIIGVIVLILIGIALLILAEWLARRRQEGWAVAFSIFGWILLVLGCLGSIVFSIILFVFVIIKIRHANNRKRSFLWLLAISTEKSIPLVPVIKVFARECGGGYSRRLRKLLELLNQGMLLPFALQRIPRLVPADALPLIHSGFASGALAQGLRRAANAKRLHQPALDSLMSRFLYLCVMCTTGLFICLFIFMKILPNFVKMFVDYNSPLPNATHYLIEIGRSSTPLGMMLFGFVPIAALLGMIYAILRESGVILFDLPFFGRFVRRADTALILDSLALAVEHQLSLPQALTSLTIAYPKTAVRRRLNRVLADIETGRDWRESLLARGLIRKTDLAVLQAAGPVGNLAWALAEMADSNRRRLAYRLYATIQLLYPAVILVLGSLVMFIVVGIFMPLIALINKGY
jgi:type II secretory pathway component PulF